MGYQLDHRRVLVLFALALGEVFCLTACKGPEARLPAIAAKATAAVANATSPVATARAGAAAAVLAEWKKGLSFGDAIDLANDLLDKDPNATAFAGGVLDAIEQAGSAVGLGGEFEIFWMKVGRLACKAADTAMATNRLLEARTLVLAGSSRWQHDSYWRRYPDHDGLAAIILAASGERDTALQRLRSREELESPAKEVYDAILRGPQPPKPGTAAKP